MSDVGWLAVVVGAYAGLVLGADGRTWAWIRDLPERVVDLVRRTL